MERALVLGTLAFSSPRNIINKFMSMPGVTEASLIYGPYDFYVLVRTETKERLSDVVLRIRSTEGVASTMTCPVMGVDAEKPSPKE